MDRFQLAIDAIRRVGRLKSEGDAASQFFHAMLKKHKEYIVQHGEDMPEIRDWVWGS
jgi:xylulose-5-phosphate/fructose-6-phosphate phosphoketolase